MISSRHKPEIYFHEPRLRMTAAGRFFIRVSASVSYGLFAAAAFVLSFSDLRPLKSAGLFIALVLAERIFHLGKPERTLAHLPRRKANAADFLTRASYRLLESAWERSRIRKSRYALELMGVLAGRKGIREGLKRMDVAPDEFSEKVKERLAVPPRVSERDFYGEASFIAIAAFEHALRRESRGIEPEDVFAGVLRAKDPDVVNLLALFEIGEGDLESVFFAGRLRRGLALRRDAPRNAAFFLRNPHRSRHRIMNRAWTARPTPFLDRMSVDLTDAARRRHVGFLIGHEREYNELVSILSRPGNPNAILVGEAGAGKETIVHRLARDIVADRVPPPLFDRRLISLSLGSLSAGAREGELQARVERIVDEIIAAGNIILFIPEIHNLVKGGSVLSVSAADILMPALAGSAFSVVGATHPREFKRYIEENSDVAGAFQTVRVNELSERESVQYLLLRSILFEREYRVAVSFKSVKTAVFLAHKYVRGKRLPGSAEELLGEAVADAREKGKRAIRSEDIIAIAERRVRIPLHLAERTEAERLLRMEERIHERFINQEEAVKAVALAIREYRSGVSRRGGPIASFLFVGPTGVGKTELAKTLTELQFGKEKFMLRFDMSEYQSKESIFQFLGSPDGSVRGNLTDAVLENPYSLILLDEFEKAHPDIVNLFLQVFDDARLTDSVGRTVDFENTIIIATSNAHSEFIKTELERGAPIRVMGEQLKRKLIQFFKPELLNRFSAIIVFQPLAPDDIEAVTRILLSDFSATLRENQGIEVQWDETALSEIARLGYDPVFGARPLRRVISERLRSVFAEKILRKEIARGDTITVSFAHGEFQFTNV